MKKSSAIVKVLCIVLVMAFVLAACGPGDTPQDPPPPVTGNGDAGTDAATNGGDEPPAELPHVHLFGFVPGDASVENDVMMEYLNAALTRDINTTIEFQFIGWGEWFDRYPLLMAAGDGFDFVYIASWNNFARFARMGAYLDITDMIPTYAPDIWAFVEPVSWNCASMHGRIYGIPLAQPQVTASGLTYRSDWGDYLGVPRISDIDTIEQYLAAVIEWDPTQDLAWMGANNDNRWFRNIEFISTGWQLDYFGMMIEEDDPTAQVFSKYHRQEFVDIIYLMADWHDRGFWTAANALGPVTFTNTVEDAPFAAERSPFFGLSSGSFNIAENFIIDNDLGWEIDFWNPRTPSGHTHLGASLNDGISVSPNSPHPERVLMAFNTILMNAEYHWLIRWGVEGRHHVIGEDGWPTLPDDVDPGNVPFAFGMHPVAWIMNWYHLPGGVLPPPRETSATRLVDAAREVGIAPTLQGFSFDVEPVEAEIAVLADVRTEWEIPLEWGIIRTSVQADIDHMIALQQAAGIDRVIAEMQRQIDYFLGN